MWKNSILQRDRVGRSFSKNTRWGSKIIELKQEELCIFTDGASRGNPGPSGAAALIYDNKNILIDKISRFLGQSTNNVAEYSALLLALQRSIELGAKRVKIITDSQLMARQWIGLYKVKNLSIKRLFHEAKQFAEKLEDVQVIHVNRTENIEADKLVNEVIDQNV